jgi:hypothetical protein
MKPLLLTEATAKAPTRIDAIVLAD